MNSLAIIIVIISALIHSFWNLFSKKSKNNVVFNWYMILFGPIIFFPVFLYFIFSIKVPPIGWLFIIISGFFLFSYLYSLGKAYSHGNLSLTYPIARSSVIFIPFLAYFLINERLSKIGIIGIIIILIGIYLLHMKSLRLGALIGTLKNFKTKATFFAFLTALFSASYSVIDKLAVNYVSPFLYIYFIYLAASVFFLPVVFSKNYIHKTINEWRTNKKFILLSAFLAILSYGLILFAFRIDKVSYIVSLRQLSIVFGVLWGTIILKEEYGRIRIMASIVMLIGFILVATA